MILSADLDQTLLFSRKRLADATPVRPVEFREGEPCGFMTARALDLVRILQRQTVFFVNTLRGEAQAKRVVFVGDGSCAYVAAQNGLYLYRNGVEDTGWSQTVARTVARLPACLPDMAARVHAALGGIACLSKQYEYLAVFFVDEQVFDQAGCNQMAAELALEGWELYRQRKKLYLSPLAIDKGAVLRRVRELEDGAHAVGFGDSYFDLPMLRECRAAYSLRGCELERLADGLPAIFSDRPGPAGTEQILQQILALTKLGESEC